MRVHMRWCSNVPRGEAEEEEKESKRGWDGGIVKQDVRSGRSTGINWGEAASSSQRKTQGRTDWRTTHCQASRAGPYKAHVRWRRSSTTGAVREVRPTMICHSTRHRGLLTIKLNNIYSNPPSHYRWRHRCMICRHRLGLFELITSLLTSWVIVIQWI